MTLSFLLSPSASPSSSPRGGRTRGMNDAVSLLHAAFNKGAKALQDAIATLEKELMQQVQECEDNWRKREQELDERERALARREKVVKPAVSEASTPTKREKVWHFQVLQSSTPTRKEKEPSSPSRSASPPTFSKGATEPGPVNRWATPLVLGKQSLFNLAKDHSSVRTEWPFSPESPPKLPKAKPSALTDFQSPRKSLFDLANGLFEAPAPEAKQQPESIRAADVPKRQSSGIREMRKNRLLLSRRPRSMQGINWKYANPSKWVFPEAQTDGDYSYCSEPVLEKIQKPISNGLEDLKASPDLYDGLFYQNNMLEWPEDQQKYTLVKRTGSGFKMQTVPGGRWTWVKAKYQGLAESVDLEPDKYTDSMHYRGYRLPAHVMPGRGHDCSDHPDLKLIDVAHPRDVMQGAVGDCWLLSAISAVAEHEGVIASFFRKTPRLSQRPLDTFNHYTVTLYDLSSPEWKPVDIVVDERLCSKADNSGLLGSLPSRTGELWACYLEKAIAAHCGGWDEIDGGTCTHAWRLLLGCREVYTFKQTREGWSCYGKYDSVGQKWELLANSPHRGYQGLHQMPWPDVGGGGDSDLKVDNSEFFERMCAWDDADFILAASSKAGSDTDVIKGIVQGHSYTILQCVNDVAGTDIDLIQLRNPWGHCEYTHGKWIDEGSGWDEYPNIKNALNPSVHNNGVFWMSDREFSEHFETVYLCASDMSKVAYTR
mmetsp:Transcript_140674/g.262478  ORF Transcript_140674/g.262478 Transcript_140674/m.262478 type:complete len:713 (-) Transcript_140674:49-2187(-)